VWLPCVLTYRLKYGSKNDGNLGLFICYRPPTTMLEIRVGLWWWHWLILIGYTKE
jgi:hypothetical protein